MSCKIITIDLANVPPIPIRLGVAGENAFRTITFDATEWGADFHSATYTVVYKRPDGYLYPVLVNAAADAIVWSPTETDTATSGSGLLEVRLLDGETVGKTITMQTVVAPSLTGDESTPPQPAPDWVNDVAADADRAELAVTHYPKIVNGVWYVWSVQDEDFVSTGIEAQGEDGYSPTVTVTEIEGGHRVTITDADGAHTFDVLDGDSGVVGVDSVNGKTGVVVLDASDVGALPNTYTAPVQSVNGQTGAVVLGASDVHALPDSTVIPPTVTEQTVAGWGFTKNTGTYSKPSGGIPKSDLAEAVQTSLGKADTALQTAPVTSVNGMTGDVVVTVDSALSGTSENPVQNKVITAEVNGLNSDLGILLEPEQSANLYNGGFAFGYRVNQTEILESNTYVYSTPIALAAGDYLFPSTEAQLGASNGRRVWIVDQSGNASSSIDGTVVGAKSQDGKYSNRNIIHFTMPSDGYVSMNIGVDTAVGQTVNQVNNFMVVRGTSIGDFPDYVPYSSGGFIFKSTISLTEKMTSQVNGLSGLIGKTAIFDGDSICAGTSVGDSEPTRGYGWAGRIGTANGMKWKNFGVDGGVITSASNASVSDKHSVCDNVDTMYAQYPNADFIIFEGGTNDADKAVTIGDVLENDFSGTYDATTFCGALNTIFYKATNYWKGKAIGYIVAHKMGRGANNRTTRATYFTAAKSVCEKWGVPVIDLWDGCYLNPDNPNLWNQSLTKEQNIAQGYLYTDGQHLTAKGYDYISPMIEGWMKGV